MELCKLPQRVRAHSQAEKRIFVHFEDKVAHLATTISIVFCNSQFWEVYWDSRIGRPTLYFSSFHKGLRRKQFYMLNELAALSRRSGSKTPWSSSLHHCTPSGRDWASNTAHTFGEADTERPITTSITKSIVDTLDWYNAAVMGLPIRMTNWNRPVCRPNPYWTCESRVQDEWSRTPYGISYVETVQRMVYVCYWIARPFPCLQQSSFLTWLYRHHQVWLSFCCCSTDHSFADVWSHSLTSHEPGCDAVAAAVSVEQAIQFTTSHHRRNFT